MAEHVKIRETVKGEAFASWPIGGDDVMVKLTFPISWGLVFGGAHYTFSNVVWADLSVADAKAFGQAIIDAANTAEADIQEYMRYQEEHDTE